MATTVKKTIVKKKEPEPSKYVVDIRNVKEPIAKDEPIGQITWNAESDTLTLHIQDTRCGADLEQFMISCIATSDGKGFNPTHESKDWVLNLSKVAKGSLWKKNWMAGKARAIYED